MEYKPASENFRYEPRKREQDSFGNELLIQRAISPSSISYNPSPIQGSLQRSVSSECPTGGKCKVCTGRCKGY